MSIFQLKQKISATAIMRYSMLISGLLTAIFFSWLFLFIYKHIYFVIAQETAIINLRSQLVITKVHKTRFNNIIKKFETKQKPLATVNFKILKNPFKSDMESK